MWDPSLGRCPPSCPVVLFFHRGRGLEAKNPKDAHGQNMDDCARICEKDR